MAIAMTAHFSPPSKTEEKEAEVTFPRDGQRQKVNVSWRTKRNQYCVW